MSKANEDEDRASAIDAKHQSNMIPDGIDTVDNRLS
jgi:hypothetical protein